MSMSEQAVRHGAIQQKCDHTAVQLVRIALESGTAVEAALDTPVIPGGEFQSEPPRIVRGTDHALGVPSQAELVCVAPQ